MNKFKELKSIMKENNLSELVIFGRHIQPNMTIRPEIEYTISIFIDESKKYTIDQFKKTNNITRGQNWSSEYTKQLKKRIDQRSKSTMRTYASNDEPKPKKGKISVTAEVICDIEKSRKYYEDRAKTHPLSRSVMLQGVDNMNAIKNDLAERSEKGVKKYGTELQTNNGRNALVDAYQESLDLLCYLKQYNLEHNNKLEKEYYEALDIVHMIKIKIEEANHGK